MDVDMTHDPDAQAWTTTMNTEMDPSKMSRRAIGIRQNGGLTITIGANGKPPGGSGTQSSVPAGGSANVDYEEGARLGDQFVSALEERYIANRDEIITESGINTPLYVLRELAREQGMQVHFETHELKITEHWERFQVEILLGNFIGVGEANQKKLATQIAAADLLESFIEKGGQVSQFGMIPGFRINPGIFADLVSLSQALKIPRPIFVEMSPDPELMSPPLYTYKCQVGQLIVTGESDSRSVAKRYAAKKMFETLSGETIELDRVEYGAYSRIFERYNVPKRDSKLRQKLLQEVRSQSGMADAEVDNTAKAPKVPITWRDAGAIYYSDEEDGNEEENAMKMKEKRMGDPENVVHKITKTVKLVEIQQRLKDFDFN